MAEHDIDIGEGIGKRADVLDERIKLIDEIDIEENTEQNERKYRCHHRAWPGVLG